VSRLTFARITNATIEKRHKCLFICGEKEGRCSCGIGVIHEDIPHGGAYPPAGGAHNDDQYPWVESGGGVV
jgi:hypothetical protein